MNALNPNRSNAARTKGSLTPCIDVFTNTSGEAVLSARDVQSVPRDAKYACVMSAVGSVQSGEVLRAAVDHVEGVRWVRIEDEMPLSCGEMIWVRGFVSGIGSGGGGDGLGLRFPSRPVQGKGY